MVRIFNVFKSQSQRGFTIVELLIVVVVITILAVITIVAYNGINDRAKASAAASAVQQVGKKIAAYAITNEEQYPAALSDIGISNGSATYQYRVNNTVSPKTFCVTATTSGVSAWVSNASTAPTAGVCAGHANTGQALITNLITNPSFELSTTGWSGGNGSGVITATTTRAFSGSQSLLWQAPASPVSDSGAQYPMSGLTVGQAYTASAYIYQPAVVGSGTLIGVYQNGWTRSTATSATNAWTRISVTFTATQTNSTLFIGSTAAPSASAQFTADAVQLLTGSANPPYADGGSAGWAWNGAAHSSTSTGPSL